jgi:hypothetical protein
MMRDSVFSTAPQRAQPHFDTRQSEDWIERVVEWIPDDVVEDVWPLWAERLSASEVELLRKHLSMRPGLKSSLIRQS